MFFHFFDFRFLKFFVQIIALIVTITLPQHFFERRTKSNPDMWQKFPQAVAMPAL
jgi:hypothetical protein